MRYLLDSDSLSDLYEAASAGHQNITRRVAAVRGAYLEAAETIQSDYEHHRALSAAVASGKLSGDSLLAVLRSAQGIRSDYERASLLVEIAGKYGRLSGPARDAYVEAANSIRSQYERGRAEEALKAGR